MELEPAAARRRQSGSLILAAIAAVFTIGHVATMLGEDEEWLWEISDTMDPDDGCLWAYGVGEDGVRAFTPLGIECLQELIRDLRAAGEAPPPTKLAE